MIGTPHNVQTHTHTLPTHFHALSPEHYLRILLDIPATYPGRDNTIRSTSISVLRIYAQSILLISVANRFVFQSPEPALLLGLCARDLVETPIHLRIL